MTLIVIFICSEVSKMGEYIECYPEYLNFEKSVRFALMCLNFSFIPRNLFRGLEKFLYPLMQSYTVVSCVFTMMYLERDLMEYVLGVVTFVGGFQLLIKTVAIVTHSDQLDALFSFIRRVHQVHKIDSITKSANTHLEFILHISKIILK